MGARPLQGRVALVTGASSGIGAATAQLLAAQGVKVALLARREARLVERAEAIRARGGQALALPADVTDEPAVRAAIDRIVDTWGRLDVLVNNAGVGFGAPFAATTAAELRHLLDVNLVAVLTTTQAALPHLARHGAGHIVNVGSIASRRGTPFRAAYAATKFALVGLTEALRMELRGTGVAVSLVYPIVTDTEFATVEVRKVPLTQRGPVQSAERVARSIVACVRRPRAEVYPYPAAKVVAVLAALVPGLADRVIARATRTKR